MNRIIEIVLTGALIGVMALCVHAVASVVASLPSRRRAAWLAAALALLGLGALTGLWAPQQIVLGDGGSPVSLIALFLLWCVGGLLGAVGAIATLGVALGMLRARFRPASPV